MNELNFSMLKYKYIFQIKYTEAILSNSTQKLLWFEITKMLNAVLKKFIVSSITIFSTLSFPSGTALIGHFCGEKKSPHAYFLMTRLGLKTQPRTLIGSHYQTTHTSWIILLNYLHHKIKVNL